MRFLWLAVVLAGCGGGISGQDPHELTVCDESTGPGKVGNQCELACSSDRPLEATECDAVAIFVDGEVETGCSQTFEFDGVRGCCKVDFQAVEPDPGIVFAECQ